MFRLAFFGLVVIVAAIAWVAKQAAGAATGDEKLRETTFKDQTQKTMDSTARGINWLERKWDLAKIDANKGKGISSRKFKN